MKRFKIFIKRFEDVDAGSIYMDVVLKADKVKETASKVTSALTDIEKSVNKTISGLENVGPKGSTSIKKLQTSIKSLMKDSTNLNKLLGNMSKQKGITGNFAQLKATQKNQEILSKQKIGFTGGESDNSKQLLKEISLLESLNQKKAKLVKSEVSSRLSAVNEEVRGAERRVLAEEKASERASRIAQKEYAQKQKALKDLEEQANQQQVEKRVKVDFQQSYTDIGGNAKLTAQYREQYQALMELLTAEQQDTFIKRLMKEESDKLVNSTIAQIKEQKEQAMSSTKNVSAMDKLRNAMNSVNSVASQGKKAFKSFVNEFKSIAVTWRIISGALKGIGNGFSSIFDNAASYEEALNLYKVSMGEYVDEATAWGNKISEALYLDPKNIMQYTGSFYNLIQGMGASSEAAKTMAMSLTQLSYDMSSYLNIDVDAAHDKLQSAMAGQSRAVASAGVATQQATLQELAYSLGIKKSVSAMTQAEKTYLRYIQVMNSTKKMQGDLARTIVTPENALRVIKNQFDQLSRAMGRIFIPIVMKATPYIMVLTQALSKLAEWLSKLTGYKVAEIDYDSVKGLNSGLEQVGETADEMGEKINRSLAPFDNLNVVESESDKGKGNESVLPELEQYIKGYDMLEGYTDQFNQELEQAKEKMKSWLPIVATIGGLIVAWKLSTTFLNGMIEVDNFLKAWDAMEDVGIFGKLGGSLGQLIGIGGTLGVILLVAAAIAGIGYALWDLYQTDEEFKKAMDEHWNSLKEALEPVIKSIEDLFTELGNNYENTLKPFGKAVEEILGGLADITLSIIIPLFNDLLLPVIDLLIDMVTEIFKVLDDMWTKHGEPIKDAIIEAINRLKTVWTKLYEQALKPVIDKLVTAVTKLWEDTLKPMFHKIGDAIALLIEGILLFWNKVIFPLANWIVDTFGPIISSFATIIIESFKVIFDIIGGVINGLLDIFNGLLDFLIGIFTGDWGRAWDGVVGVLKGVLNIGITIVEGFVNCVILIINSMISVIWNGIKTLANSVLSVIEGIADFVGIDIDITLKGRPPEIPQLHIPRLKVGMDFVPSDFYGPVYLDYGERVLTREENQEYMSNLGNNTATSTDVQSTQELGNIILEGMMKIEANRKPPLTQVYLGNEKLYEGYGKHQNREADRYGTTYIKV